MMWGYYSGMSGWMVVWMVLSSLFWLVLVAIAVWALVRFVTRRPSSSARYRHDATYDATQVPAGPSADEILRQRFARGEIDADTFQRMRTQLEQASPREPALPGN